MSVPESKKLRLMLDTNIYDKLDSDAAVNESLKKMIRDERIELITTHIQEDELAMAPEITGAESEKIPTEGFILGVSRLGQASHHADYLITEDKRLLKKLKQLPTKCVVLDFEGLKNLLARL